MSKWIIALISSALAFGVMDAMWLRTMGPKLYRPEIGELLAAEFRMAPALIFYFIYLVGMQVFAIAPALANGKWTTALLYGALFGLVAYATYDLTNHAVMKVWSLKVTVLDMAWGTFATATASAIGAAIALKFAGRA